MWITRINGLWRFHPPCLYRQKLAAVVPFQIFDFFHLFHFSTIIYEFVHLSKLIWELSSTRRATTSRATSTSHFPDTAFFKNLQIAYAETKRELIQLKSDNVVLTRELGRKEFMISLLKLKLEKYEVTVKSRKFSTEILIESTNETYPLLNQSRWEKIKKYLGKISVEMFNVL